MNQNVVAYLIEPHGFDELKENVYLLGSELLNYCKIAQKLWKQTIVGWYYFLTKYVQPFFSFNQVFGYKTWNELKQTTFIDDKIFTKISYGFQTVLLQSLWFVPEGIHTLITVFMANFWCEALQRMVVEQSMQSIYLSVRFITELVSFAWLNENLFW